MLESSVDRQLEDEPPLGLAVRWEGEVEVVPRDIVTLDLVGEVGRLLAAVDRKFRAFDGARRVLVVEGFGDARWMAKEDWLRVLEQVPLTDSVDEFWTCTTYQADRDRFYDFEEVLRRSA